MIHEEMMREKHKRWHEMSAVKKVVIILGWVALSAVGVAAFGLVVMLLWNRIMSAVIGLPALGFWEAVGLFLLAKILFGGRPGAMIGKMRMRRLMRERMAASGEVLFGGGAIRSIG